MATIEDIRKIPDFPALKQLARALWRDDPTHRGAAVLVGSGFSLNAEMSTKDAPRPPTWSVFSEEMERHLYPHSSRHAPKDPLRLAEEYRAYFGQTSLDEFIRSRIRDESWRPGAVHRSLLELPWADVLTTNWDTLLERSSRSVFTKFYETVSTPGDLAHARAPRIVKLHGSIGASEHFIVAEEDYRTYPRKFAAFVNLARQIFIENELCLLGFSGDDPNFLQWSGWVRDELGSSARRIYLTGVLELEPAKRKLLEARNVAPIDLAPALKGIEVRDERHKEAIRLLLEFLAREKPAPLHGWAVSRSLREESLGRSHDDHVKEIKRINTDHVYAASLLEKEARSWQADRETYPSWLICPPDRRADLLHRTDMALGPTQARIDAMSSGRRAEVLYEIAWRHRTALWPVDANLAILLAQIADPQLPCGLGQERQLEVAAILLVAARRSGDDAEFERWAAVIDKHSSPETDIRAEVFYQKSLRARDRLEFNEVLTGASSLRTAPDPIWRVRLASLHCELGEFEEAKALVGEALRDLNGRQRENKASLWVMSRRAWAQFVDRAIRLNDFSRQIGEEWPLEFKAARCDPWHEIEHIENLAASELLERRKNEIDVLPLFDPGHYRTPSATRRFGKRTLIDLSDTLDLLSEAAGLPMRIDMVDLIGTVAKDVAEVTFDADDQHLSWWLRLLRSFHNHDDPLIERYFGRVRVAQMPVEIASYLAGKILPAISFWRRRLIKQENEQLFNIKSVERLRVYIEILSRLTARQSPAGALDSYQLAMEIAAGPTPIHFWLYKPIGALINRAVQATRPEDLKNLIFSAIRFPLSTERKVPHPTVREWPNPIEAFFGASVERPNRDAKWDARIEELIRAVKSDSQARAEASLRLVFLMREGILSEDERLDFARALWEQLDAAEPSLPAGTQLLTHVFAGIDPSTDFDPRDRVRARLFDQFQSQKLSDQLLAIAAASSATVGGLQPSSQQAVRLFDRLAAWRPSELDPNSLEAVMSQWQRHEERRLVGQALSTAAVPNLSVEDLTADRLQSVLDLIDRAGVRTAISALPYFAATNGTSGLQTAVIDKIRRGVVSNDPDEVSAAVTAIGNWVQLAKSQKVPNCPTSLVEQVIASVETQREVGLVHNLLCTRRLIEDDEMGLQELTPISAALGDLAISTAYAAIKPESRMAATVSLVRRECVLLARTLRAKGVSVEQVERWVEAAEVDPLPEVRFAIAEQ